MTDDAQARRQRAEEIARKIARDKAPDPMQAAMQLCGKDEALLLEVLNLLGEQSTENQPGSTSHAEDLLANRKIGGYKTHWRLGSGGNGDVYLATRLKEPHQQVAMKFLRLTEGENDEFRRRFLRERQIIALLSHPYIVKLFDADRTKEGRPYFVMEYVSGSDLEKFANAKRLTVIERLHLFLKVCDAVQYLHQHLIVHRDLKPANIMVDTEGTPKVLDFGIAKLLRPELMDGELITMTDRHPLTKQYASPEQWEGGLVTSSSDVYSLGVILFQLLTGNLPVPWEGKHISEYRRRVCEEVPPRASDSVMEKHAAQCREPGLSALAHKLSGDLDAILAMALDKDVNERYPTVAALTEDIRRHLQMLPVRARGKSGLYRARRFLRRNRVWVFSALAVVVALALGLSIALYQRNEARAQREEAERETARVKQLIGQRDAMLQTLERQVADSGSQDQQFRVAIVKLTDGLQRTVDDDKRTYGEGRGDADPYPYVLRARNYEVLGQLLTLSGNKSGARQAYQGCVSNLTRAQRAGDSTQATADAMRRCEGGL